MRRLKLITFVPILIIFTLFYQSFAQESSRKSGKVKVNLEKSYMYPPDIKYTIDFKDPSHNGQLDAEEKCSFVVKLKNEGMGIAKNLSIKIDPPEVDELYFNPYIQVGDILPGEDKSVDFYISASILVHTQTITLTFNFSEERGFDLPSAKVNFNTKSFDPPKLQISDEIAIEDASGNSQIELGELVTLKVIVFNSGLSDAKEVTAKITLGENVFFGSGSASTYELGEIMAHQFKEIKFDIYTNMRATEIAVFVSVSESYHKYGVEKHQIPLSLNKIYAVSNEFNIEKTINELPVLNENKFIVDDLKENIPKTDTENNDGIAVIIGNRDYIRKDIPPVNFALRDASLVKEYLKSAFGYKEQNIIYRENITQAEFNSIFGTSNNYKGILNNYVKDGVSDVFIYYSGHGAPDPGNKQGYFVPVDCDPSLVSLNGYSLNTFYANLSKINYKSLTVVIDACFSGSSDNGTLLKNISPIFISIENPVVSHNNTIIFTSADRDQVSSWYTEKKHSLFTYFFLKGLKGEANLNNDDKLTVSELEKYILENVPYLARRLNNREQTPQFFGDTMNKVLLNVNK